MQVGSGRKIIVAGALMMAGFLLGVVYGVGYGFAREYHLIVHRMGYSGALVAQHRVGPGDFGAPMLAPSFSIVASTVHYAYVPLERVETMFWHQHMPIGSKYPHPDVDALKADRE